MTFPSPLAKEIFDACIDAGEEIGSSTLDAIMKIVTRDSEQAEKVLVSRITELEAKVKVLTEGLSDLYKCVSSDEIYIPDKQLWAVFNAASILG